MGRFSKLDFEEQAAPVTAPVHDPWPNQDEHQCIKRAEDMVAQGDYEAALSAYSRALRYNRDLESAWAGQVHCLIELREFPEALTWSDRALERFAKSSELLANKGLALVHMGQVLEGLEYLDGAIELRSPSANAWLARGEGLLLAAQPVANAQRCFMKALELAEIKWPVDMRIGIAFNKARQWALAKQHFGAAMRAKGNSALLLYQMGVTQESLGEWKVAAGFYHQALALRRDYSDARNALHRVQSTNPLTRMWHKLKG